MRLKTEPTRNQSTWLTILPPPELHVGAFARLTVTAQGVKIPFQDCHSLHTWPRRTWPRYELPGARGAASQASAGLRAARGSPVPAWSVRRGHAAPWASRPQKGSRPSPPDTSQRRMASRSGRAAPRADSCLLTRLSPSPNKHSGDVSDPIVQGDLSRFEMCWMQG